MRALGEVRHWEMMVFGYQVQGNSVERLISLTACYRKNFYNVDVSLLIIFTISAVLALLIVHNELDIIGILSLTY